MVHIETSATLVGARLVFTSKLGTNLGGSMLLGRARGCCPIFLRLYFLSIRRKGLQRHRSFMYKHDPTMCLTRAFTPASHAQVTMLKRHPGSVCPSLSAAGKDSPFSASTRERYVSTRTPREKKVIDSCLASQAASVLAEALERRTTEAHPTLSGTQYALDNSDVNENHRIIHGTDNTMKKNICMTKLEFGCTGRNSANS